MRSLSEAGQPGVCPRLTDECNNVYWPAREVVILVEITDFETQWRRYVGETLSLGKRYLSDNWPYTTVPVMNDQVLAPLALRPSSHMPLPDSDFTRVWSDCIDKPIFSSTLVEKFDEAITACVYVSAIITCRGVKRLASGGRRNSCNGRGHLQEKP